jgi:hypothetical protein
VRPSDLAVNLQASSTNGLLNGSPITYTLTYENEGLAEASRIRIDHPLPDILSNPIVSYSDASMAQIQNSRLSWELEKLSPGEGGVIVVTGIVDATGPTTISTLASIESPIPDANPNNNVAGPVQTVIIDEHPTASVFQEAHAFVSPGIITLNWETANEIALIGFNLYRSNHANELGARLNQTLILAANTMTPIGAVYSYQDRDVSAGQTYYYTIEIVETYGSLTYSLQQTMPENFIFLPLAWNTSQ